MPLAAPTNMQLAHSLAFTQSIMSGLQGNTERLFNQILAVPRVAST